MLRGDKSIAELALAAGAVGSSFDAEAFTAVRAFQEIAELEIKKRKHGSMVYRQQKLYRRAERGSRGCMVK